MRRCTPNSSVLPSTLMAELCTIILHFNIFQIEDGEALGKLNDEGRDEIIQEDKGESQPIGLAISWNNCRDGNISLLPRNVVFLSMTLPNLLTMWYFGDRSNNIPPYWIIRGSDMREMKGGIKKFSMMKKFMKTQRREYVL